jgi:hypothetical protein
MTDRRERTDETMQSTESPRAEQPRALPTDDFAAWSPDERDNFARLLAADEDDEGVEMVVSDQPEHAHRIADRIADIRPDVAARLRSRYTFAGRRPKVTTARAPREARGRERRAKASGATKHAAKPTDPAPPEDPDPAPSPRSATCARPRRRGRAAVMSASERVWPSERRPVPTNSRRLVAALWRSLDAEGRERVKKYLRTPPSAGAVDSTEGTARSMRRGDG